MRYTTCTFTFAAFISRKLLHGKLNGNGAAERTAAKAMTTTATGGSSAAATVVAANRSTNSTPATPIAGIEIDFGLDVNMDDDDADDSIEAAPGEHNDNDKDNENVSNGGHNNQRQHQLLLRQITGDDSDSSDSARRVRAADGEPVEQRPGVVDGVDKEADEHQEETGEAAGSAFERHTHLWQRSSWRSKVERRWRRPSLSWSATKTCVASVPNSAEQVDGHGEQAGQLAKQVQDQSQMSAESESASDLDMMMSAVANLDEFFNKHKGKSMRVFGVTFRFYYASEIV